MAAIPWTLKPGDSLLRTDLHEQYGGAGRGGMEPSAKTPNVFLFTNQKEGSKYGYDFDGWHPDGTFHYTGEGTVGDQQMANGNRVTRDHIDEERSLRLFVSVGKVVTYVGEFLVPDESHILIDEALDVNQAELRKVFVFRLKPVGEPWAGVSIQAPKATLVENVPLEANDIDEYIRNRKVNESVGALRREAQLVKRFAVWLAERNLTANRQKVPTPAGHLMFTDLFVIETEQLIEAKASSSRHHIRLALGQVLDYARYVEHSTLGILTPSEPEPEMISLMNSFGVEAIWEAKAGNFVRTPVPNEWNR